jgi:ribulose-5-phosphate 4-epimerase/fuculose-1-phosphate aldolase
MRTAARKSTVTRIRSRRLPSGVGAAEWDARCELAAAFRIAARLGWSDMLGTHFSLRAPGVGNQFLIQLAALSGDAEPNPIPQDIVDYTADLGR